MGRGRWLLALLLGFSLSSCVTIGRHEALEDRVRELEKFRRDTQLVLERDVTRIENLSQKLKAAAEELRKASAGVGLRVHNLEEELRKLRGEVEELTHLSATLADQIRGIHAFLDRRFGYTPVRLPKDLPNEPKGHFEAGMRAFQAGQWDLARAIFQEFLRRYPSDERAGRAELFVGETYRKQGRYRDALKAYGRVVAPWEGRMRKAPPEVAEAMWYAAMALEASGQCAKARAMLELLVRSFRKAALAAQAKERLESLRCTK